MKRLLLVLSLFAIVGCGKQDINYKRNIPYGKHDGVSGEAPIEYEYTLEDLADQWVGGKVPTYVQVDRFIQGYMTATNVNVVDHVSARYYMYLSFDGETLKGGPYKSDPRDYGFDEVADSCGDAYGEDDATISEYVENPVIVCRQNVKFDVYVVKGDYDANHPEGSLLNNMATYSYNVRKRYKSLGKWFETLLIRGHQSLVDYNNSDIDMVVITDSFLYIPLPTNAGTYSFRFVAKSGDNILCDRLIEDVELPAK